MSDSELSQESCIGDRNNSAVRYFVASGMGGGWLIFQEGERRAIHSQQRKILAVETARSIAREHAPSQVMVERADGMFFLKYVFGPAGDCQCY